MWNEKKQRTLDRLLKEKEEYDRGKDLYLTFGVIVDEVASGFKEIKTIDVFNNTGNGVFISSGCKPIVKPIKTIITLIDID